jgi:hypothetical protein
MLHYCFKNKQLLFEAVYMNAFSQLTPHINAIFNSDESGLKKNNKVHPQLHRISNRQSVFAAICNAGNEQ